jgi:hypothetical protein
MSYQPATSVGKSLLTAASASAGRTTLELGTMAEQDADAVAITGGTITGVTVSEEEAVTLVDATTYTVLSTDEIIIVTHTAAACTVTLPAATTGNVGRVITVKRAVTVTGFDTTIDGNSSDLIDGAANFVLSTAGESISMVVVGTGMWAIF